MAGALAHVYLLLQGLRRYTVGIAEGHVNWTEMFAPHWQPPFSWQGLALAYIVVLGIAGYCLYRLLTSPQGTGRGTVLKQGTDSPSMLSS